MTREYTIVIFDGVCTLCNHTVDFLTRHDPSGEFRFASFQSPIGTQLLAEQGVVGPPTTVYVITRTNTLLVESEAMIHLGTLIGGPWAMAARVIRVVPRGLRNSIYQWTSRNRYRWFGMRSTCRVPTPKERSRFL